MDEVLKKKVTNSNKKCLTMIDGNVFWEYNYRVTNQAIFCPFKNIMGATANKKNIFVILQIIL